MDNFNTKISVLFMLFILFSRSLVGYVYEGYRCSKNNFPTYKVNQTGTPDCSGEFTAISNAIQTWDAVTTTYINFQNGPTTTVTAMAYDGTSLIRWIESGWDNIFPEYPSYRTLAVNSNWVSGVTILESDIMFNGQGHVWSDNGQENDVQAVALHEIGHSVGLDHSQTSDAVMYEYNQNFRTLHQDDLDGARYINFDPQLSGHFW